MNNISTKPLSGAFVLLALLSAQLLFAQVNRTIDGSNNNFSNPSWGAAGQQMTRWADACYADSISQPGGAHLVSPRVISNELFDQPLPLNDAMGLSDYCWVFAQFVDHDLTLALDGQEFLFIQVPLGDTLFDPQNTGAALIPMHRSLAAAGTGTSVGNPREHGNAITAFIDGSNVYGSDQARADWLRSFVDGKLKTSAGNQLPYNTLDGTLDTDVDPQAPHMDNPLPFYDKVFVAGDVRANENPLLAVLHTIFMREHNRLCDVLKARDPGMSDEELYQRARKLNGAILQSIVYNEWLPAMGIELAPYAGYNAQVNPAIRNEFSAAAFRMGHTLLNSQLRRLNPDGSVHPLGHMTLRDAYFNPTAIDASGGIDPFVKGMAEQTQQSFDAHLIDDVRNFLFGRPGRGGLDLAAININRGRERGLPDFNNLRASLGLTPFTSWSELVPTASVQSALATVYPGVDSVDAWVGMLAEEAMPGKLFGSTVNEALTRQFSLLRDGDRYFYLNDPALTSDDCGIIGSTRLSDVIRRNTDVDIMQGNVFTSMLHDSIPACGASLQAADLQTVVILPTGVPLEGARVRVYGMDDEMPQEDTDVAGVALISALPTCDDYGVDAQMTSDPAAGVTGFDMYLIGQHILGRTPLNDPLQLLAADVNRSGTISAFDLSNMQRVILGLDSTFFGEDAWRTFDPAHLPAAGENPLTFNYQPKVHFNLFDGSQSAILMAMKVGDVDYTYSSVTTPLAPRSLMPVSVAYSADRRSAALGFEDDQLVAAEFTLSLPEGNAVTRVEGLPESSYVLSADGKTLHLLAVAFTDALPAISLAFAKPVTSRLALHRDATATAYHADGKAHLLVLRDQREESFSAELVISPNPVRELASVQFPAALVGQGHSFNLYDAAGRQVLQRTITSQRMEWSRTELNLPVSGSMTWTVESSSDVLLSGIVQVLPRP